MLPTVTILGDREAAAYLTGVSARLRDLKPALDSVVDDVYTFEKRWWATNGQGTFGRPSNATLKRDRRGGRDPRFMFVTGGLERAATVRGAKGSRTRVGKQQASITVTHPLARIHEARGRDVQGMPAPWQQDRYAEKVASYIIDGKV